MSLLNDKNKDRKLEEIPPEQLNNFLSEVIITVKRKDGMISDLQASEDFFPVLTVI